MFEIVNCIKEYQRISFGFEFRWKNHGYFFIGLIFIELYWWFENEN
jgi:hypothetical protein